VASAQTHQRGEDMSDAPDAEVDVVIPVYNGARFLAAAIESALAQSSPPRRVIVVDDGSTDQSAEIARGLAGGQVELIVVQKANGGLSSARNAGLLACRSEFVALLDADDVWLPHKLARQVARFRDSELADLGVVYCDYDDIDEHGQPLLDFPSTRLQRGLRGDIKRRLYRGNLVAGSGSGVLVKRRCLERTGGFDERLPSSEDWELWLRLAQHYAFDYVDEVLVHLRRHGGSMQAQRERQILRTDLEVLVRQRGDALDQAAVFASVLRRLAQTPGVFVRELFASPRAEDAALLDRLSLGMPRPLFRALVFNAKLLRVARARSKAYLG
jgi:glycosyltransferase involved in cell wall biosynthesis